MSNRCNRDCPQPPEKDPQGNSDQKESLAWLIDSWTNIANQFKGQFSAFIETCKGAIKRKVTPEQVEALEKSYQISVEPSPQQVEEEIKVLDTERQTVSLYDPKSDAYVEYTEDQLFGLITGDAKVLETFGYSSDDEESLNKGLFTSMLGEFKNEKAKKYLSDILFWSFPETRGNHFSAVDTAAWLILSGYSGRDKEWVVGVFRQALTKGSYAAKLSCSLYGAMMCERDLLEPLQQVAAKEQNEELRKIALQQVDSLNTALKKDLTVKDILFPEFPVVSF